MQDGILLTDQDDIRDRWKEYIEKLYDKDGKHTEAQMRIEYEKEVQEDDKVLCTVYVESMMKEALGV